MTTKGLEQILAFFETNLIVFCLNKFHSESEAEPTIVLSTIEGGVKVVREFCCASVNAVKEKKKPVDDFITTGIGHSQCEFMIYNFLLLCLLFEPLLNLILYIFAIQYFQLHSTT